jgi:hypothetical protein
MDDSDLLEIGVTNASHRDKILLEAKSLPKVKLLTKSDEILTVDEWLESLKLAEYRNSFRTNGYNEMSRVRNLWEVELNTVLEINKLGHRKRILASLGERLRLIEDLGLDDLDFDKLVYFLILLYYFLQQILSLFFIMPLLLIYCVL